VTAPVFEQVMWSLILAAVMLGSPPLAWWLHRASERCEDRDRLRRQGDPQARMSPVIGTGVEPAALPQAQLLPRSPMAPVRAATTPDVARTGPHSRVGVTERQTATPTRHQAAGHG